MIRLRHLSHAPETPWHERVYDLYDVVLSRGSVCFATPCRDAHSLRILDDLGYRLHAASLASRFEAIPIRARCERVGDRRVGVVATIRPYHTNNLFHLLNENILPLASTVGRMERVTLVTVPGHGNGGRAPLPHWTHFLSAMGVVEVVPLDTASFHIDHMMWGLGVKPMYTATRSLQLHPLLAYRQLVLWTAPHAPEARRMYVHRTHQTRRNRELANVEWFRTRCNLDSFSLVGQSVVQQVSLLRYATSIVGMHGAGLANLIFMERPCVVELRGVFARSIDSSHQLRKMTRILGGVYASVEVESDMADANTVNKTLYFLREC